MRRSRRLTEAERWELGLFLAMLVVGCLCLTAILNINGMPVMAAESSVEQPRTAPSSFTAPLPADQTQTAAPLVLSAPPPQPVQASPTIASPEKLISKKTTPPADIKIYKGEKYRFVRTLRLRVTAYAPDGRCCWPYPGTTTATGLSVKTNHGHLVAADPRIIPMHSLVVVPGYESGAAVPVLDQGGEIKGHRLDVMLPTFEAAKEWGSRILDVKVYEPVD